MPNTARATSVRPAPTRPARATISPARTSKLISRNTPARLRPVDFQDHVADLGRRLGEKGANVAAHHLANDLLDGDVGGAVGGDVPAVPHDGDAVAEVKDLVETVRNEEDAGPAVPEAPGHGEQPFHLDAAEGGGGLVHHQDFGVQRNGLGDFNDLLVRDGQALGDAGRVDRNAEPFEQLVRFPDHVALLMSPKRPLGWRPMKMFSATLRSGKSVGSW